jgi:hypothetical protein
MARISDTPLFPVLLTTHDHPQQPSLKKQIPSIKRFNHGMHGVHGMETGVEGFIYEEIGKV